MGALVNAGVGRSGCTVAAGRVGATRDRLRRTMRFAVAPGLAADASTVRVLRSRAITRVTSGARDVTFTIDANGGSGQRATGPNVAEHHACHLILRLQRANHCGPLAGHLGARAGAVALR